MGERYCNQKKVHTFKVGDVVAQRIPRIERAATDLHCLPCIVVQRQGKKCFLYQLRCKFGVPGTLYPTSELEVYNGAQQLEVHGWEAAKKANPENAYYGKSYNCKKGCHSKLCSCRQAGKPCSTRCHMGKACTNCWDANPPSPSLLDTNPPSLLDTNPPSPIDTNPPSPIDTNPPSSLPLNHNLPSPIHIDDSCPSPPPIQWWV